MKNIYLKYLKSFLLISCAFTTFTFSVFSERANAVGLTENYISQQNAKSLSDSAFKDLFGQTGYKVGTQAEIDAIRNKAFTQNPSLTVKYPLIFGIAPDSIPVTSSTDSDYNTFCSENLDGHTNIFSKVGSDLRSWINDSIVGLPRSETVEIPVNSVGNDQLIRKSTSTVKIRLVRNDTGSSTSYKIDSDTFFSLVGEFSPGYSAQYLTFYDSSMKSTGRYLIQSTTGTTFFYKYHIEQLNSSGTVISPSTQVKTNDYSESFKDFLPYPTKQSELGTGSQTLPSTITFPNADVDSDGLLTPVIIPSSFPTVKTPPDEDGNVKKDNDIIVYTPPTIDPETGTITDPVSIPSKDPTIDPDIDPDTGFPSVDVPNTVPTLNFNPLMLATRKFPFCIPWDLWDCYKIFEGNSEPFKYEFKQVEVNFAFIGCGSVTVLPNFTLNFSDYPQVDTAIQIFKFLELMGFMVFLILKTRTLIRG